jgi:hypothetical protein
MTVLQAAWYRLYASRATNRAQCVGWRLGLCAVLCSVLGVLLFRLTPAMALGAGLIPTVCLAFCLVSTITTLLFVCICGYQQQFMTRLAVLQYLPLKSWQRRGLHWLSFVPAIFLTASVAIPLTIRVLMGTSADIRIFIYVLASYAAVVLCNVLLVTTRQPLSLAPRVVGLGSVGLNAVAVWQLMHTPNIWWQSAALLLIEAHMFFAIYASRRPPYIGSAKVRLPIWQIRRLTIETGLWIRAVRTARYLGANGVLLLIVSALMIAAYRNPALPFDAIGLIAVLLLGTLGQEARNMSLRRHPIELVLYGLFNKWFAATWLLAIVNAFCVLVMFLGGAVLGFPQGLGVPYGYVMCVGFCLVSLGLLAGSILVQQKGDMVTQLASTALYGGMAWGVLRVLPVEPIGQTVASAAVLVIACLAIAYVVERARQRITTGRNHASTH